MIGNLVEGRVRYADERYYGVTMAKAILSVTVLVKKAKPFLTRRIIGSYLLIAIPLTLLFAILFDLEHCS